MKIPIGHLPKTTYTLYRTFGARGLALRLVHEGRRKARMFRARPRHEVSSLRSDALFRINEADLVAATDRERALERAERVLAGEYQAYRSTWKPLPADPVAWLEHPKTGSAVAAGKPWWEVSHFDHAFGDIKDLWEPARFAWLYDLVRAYVITSDDRYSRAALKHIANWAASSPPFQGPHWSCGQESTIRAVALLYAEAAFAGAPSMNAAARRCIRDVLAATGERIADAIGYAVSQRNNHAISEATGLVLLGSRLLGDHPEAERWLEDGHELLERLIPEQFESDGWYVQHSFTYQRLALEQCVLAERGLRAVGRNLSGAAVTRLLAAADLLVLVMDPETGIVPNHGGSDGAFIHPVTLAAYRDFRPLLSEVSATWRHSVPNNVSLDEEVLAWLNLPPPPRRDAVQDGVWSGASGWAVARKGSIHVFLRAGRYSSRPGHIDPLQTDIRFGRHEIVVDPGTYAYLAPAPWRNGLAGASVHNGPLLDDREPGTRGPRFLWYSWPEADVVETLETTDAYVIVAEQPGQVRRHVTVTAHAVEIRDTVLSKKAEKMRVRWLLHPDADPAWAMVEGSVMRTAAEGATQGWFSPHYGERIPSRYLDVLMPADNGTTAVATFSRP